MLVVAACSNGEPSEPSQTTSASPAEVVAQWLDSVAAVDPDRLETVVEPVGLAVLAGVENQVRSDEFVALLDAGLAGEMSAAYWRSFRDDFESIRGFEVGEITVGQELPDSLGPDHVAVQISVGEQDSVVLLRKSPEAGWLVDMIATLGSGVVVPLRQYLQSASSGAHAEAIGDAYLFTNRVICCYPDAAAMLDPDNALLVFETEFIRQEVSG